MANAASADLAALAADLAAAGNTGINTAAERIIRQAAQRVQAEAQTQAPVRSGRLRNSISIQYPTPTTAIIGPQVEYGVYQEFGTGSRGEFPGSAYEITSNRPGGYLKFRSGTRWVYTRKVRHPGVRARRYMRGGLEAALGSDLIEGLLKAGTLLITKGPKA
jgi:phage gpG-like protein